MAEIVQGVVPDALSSVFARAFSAKDQSLWFIRELHLAVDLNMSFNPYHLAHFLAVHTTRAIAAEMNAAEGLNVIHFDNPAQYLAAFLVHLAEERAWQHWYYRSFDGLRLLPLSAALRTAICDRPDVGLSALHYLTPEAARRIVKRLTDTDASRILQPMAKPLHSEGSEAIGIVLDAFRRLSLQELSREKAALLLFVEVTRSEWTMSIAVAALCEALVSLAHCLKNAMPMERSHLLSALETRDVTILAQFSSFSDVDAIAPLLILPDPFLAVVIEEFGEKPVTTSSHEAAAKALQETAFGGAFFLLPLIDRLPLRVLGLPNEHSESLLAILRWVVLLKCFGQSRAAALARDPLLREIAGVPVSASVRDLVALWESEVTGGQLDRLLAESLRYRRDNQTIGTTMGFLGRASANGEKLAVMVDAARGCWIFLVGVSRGAAVLKSALRQLLHSHEHLFANQAQASLVRSMCPQAHVATIPDEVSFEGGVYSDLAKPVLESLGRLDEDVSYFALPAEFAISKRHDCVLSVMAQGIMRDLAWRLPGFSWSGPAYLNENFLDCEATLEQEAQRCVVILGRAPLNLILNVAGINRKHYELSWLRGRRFELYPEQM